MPDHELERNDLREGCSPAQVQDAFEWAEALVDDSRRSAVRSARVMLFVLHGDLGIAVDEFFDAIDHGVVGADLLEEVLPLLAERLPRAAPRRFRIGRSLSAATDDLFERVRAGGVVTGSDAILIDVAARHMARKRRRTHGSLGRSLLEGISVVQRGRAARKRGDNWCAY